MMMIVTLGWQKSKVSGPMCKSGKITYSTGLRHVVFKMIGSIISHVFVFF